MRKDAYFLLRVSRNATQPQIKFAYHMRVKELHPDTNPGVRSSDALKEVNAAYALISSQERREAYDARETEYNAGPASSRHVPAEEDERQQREHAEAFSEFVDASRWHSRRNMERMFGLCMMAAGAYFFLCMYYGR